MRWQAAYEVIPLDDGWRQADTIAGAIHDDGVISRYVNAGKETIPSTAFYKPGSYIPKINFARRNKTAVNNASIRNFEAVLEQRYGSYR